MKRVIGIKCFDMDLTCRGFQFEIGKTYEILGELVMCYNGFHFHHHSQLENVFIYYDNIPETRYCLVIGEDVIMDEEKTVARKITIVKELSIFEVMNIRVRKMVKQGISEDKYNNHGIITDLKDHGIASQTGGYGSAIQTGENGISSQTGYYGLASQSGYRGIAGQTGNLGISIQKGCRGIACQTEYRGSAIQDGAYGVAIATGVCGKAMVKNDKGAILIQNWIYSYDIHDWQVKNILCARVGDELPNGEVMATNTWYWYEYGELKSKKFKI